MNRPKQRKKEREGINRKKTIFIEFITILEFHNLISPYQNLILCI